MYAQPRESNMEASSLHDNNVTDKTTLNILQSICGRRDAHLEALLLDLTPSSGTTGRPGRHFLSLLFNTKHIGLFGI